MADFYSEMGSMANSLLAPTNAGGLGQGDIKLIRTIPGVPLNEWTIPEDTVQIDQLRGAVRGVDSKLVGTPVGQSVIVVSDRVAITNVPKMDYQAGDVLSLDGVPVMVLQVDKIPAVGITSAVRWIIR